MNKKKNAGLKELAFVKKIIIIGVIVILGISIAARIIGVVNSASISKTSYAIGENVTVSYSSFYINWIPILYARAVGFSILASNGTEIVGVYAAILPTWTFKIMDSGNITWNQKVPTQNSGMVQVPAGNYTFSTSYGKFNFTIEG